MGLSAWLERTWYPAAGERTTPPLALRAAARLYGLAVAARARRVEGARPLPVPCIAVGNLTVGGTGKTPLVALLVEALLELGVRPAVVSRGYGGRVRAPERVPPGGGREEAARYGDEPALLAARFPAVPVLVGRDRAAAADLAVRVHGAQAVIADDAFQHRRLARDLDLAVVDASRGFGNGRLLPAGPLREPPEALGRADLVLLTRIGAAPDADALRREVRALAPAAPLLEADLEVTGWRRIAPAGPGEGPPPGGLYGFCALANPASFRRTLEASGRDLAGWRSFRDHHSFSAAEAAELAREAAGSGAVAAATTAKDAVRLPPWPGPVPLYLVEVKLAIIRGREQLWHAVEKCAARARG